jgi:predicted metal-binding protein
VEAKVIPAKSIVAAEWVRLKCQFGCDGYGQCLTCPPLSPTPEQTRRMLGFYKSALLIHGDAYTDISVDGAGTGAGDFSGWLL